MLDISLQLLDSGSFFTPSLTGGELVSVDFFEEEFTFFENYITANGSVLGHALLAEFFSSEEVVFLPLISSPQSIETQVIDQSEVYDVIRTELLFSPNLIDSGILYDISSVFGKAISVDLLEPFGIFEPTLTSPGRQISPNFIDSLELYPIIPRVEIRLAEFSDFSFFNSTTSVKAEIVTELLEGEVFDPLVFPGNVNVSAPFIDDAYLYPIRVRGDVLEPVRFKRADTIYGGDITRNYLASSQTYYPKLPGVTYDSRSDFSYSVIPDLMDRYIPSNEALFSKTFYRAFYIRNDSSFLERRNIDFWIDGGLTYTIGDKKIHENEFLLADEENRYGVTLSNRDEIVNNGRSKTSMFNQMSISYLVSEAKNVVNFNPDGSGVGINLRSQRFVPGNTVTRLPILAPEDYVGIYLKITTKFIPDFPIKTDYSFFHLSYTTTTNGFRETYPGQLRVNNVPVNQLLPSVYLRVTTDYTTLKKYLDEDVNSIYANYPPYFLSLEDIGRAE